MSAPVSPLCPLPAGHSSGQEISLPSRIAEPRPSQLLLSMRNMWRGLSGSRGLRLLQTRSRRLQVQETVQLGEKRFVAILRVDGEQFLIGGSAATVSLLASLKPETAPSFSSVLAAQDQQEQDA